MAESSLITLEMGAYVSQASQVLVIVVASSSPGVLATVLAQEAESLTPCSDATRCDNGKAMCLDYSTCLEGNAQIAGRRN